MGRRARAKEDLDTELADLPSELRWREWMGRVEAVIFASPEPVTREVLTRVVGRDCNLDLIIDDRLFPVRIYTIQSKTKGRWGVRTTPPSAEDREGGDWKGEREKKPSHLR